MSNMQQLVIRLENPDATEPLLDAFQDKVLTALLKAKRKQSKDGLFFCKNTHGRPLVLIGVSRAEKGSSSASQSTVRQRSKVIEHIKQFVSCKQGESSSSNDSKRSCTAAKVIPKQK